jgi:hypothetical protein
MMAVDDVPVLPEESQTQHWQPLSDEEVTRILLQNAYSFLAKSVPGMARYDGTQVESNPICEDRFIHGKFPAPWGKGAPWMA